ASCRRRAAPPPHAPRSRRRTAPRRGRASRRPGSHRPRRSDCRGCREFRGRRCLKLQSWAVLLAWFYRRGRPPFLPRGLAHASPMARRTPQLGRPPPLPASPEKAKLDRVPNPHRDTVYIARFTAPEFTCLCPITGQPDFAHFVIDYVPAQWLLESKSLK